MCRRDDPSVHARPSFCPAYLCDVCNEFMETELAYSLGFVTLDTAEFVRLYDRLGELRDKIDGFKKEQRVETEKKASPRITSGETFERF